MNESSTYTSILDIHYYLPYSHVAETSCVDNNHHDTGKYRYLRSCHLLSACLPVSADSSRLSKC